MIIAKRRIVFFAYDGTGLGHLMRLIKIASVFRENFVPIVVTGHKAVSDIVTPGIEFCRIPNFESFARAMYYATSGFDTVEFRIKLLRRIVQTIKPIAIVTDHKPLGKKNELIDVITQYNCLKYLVMRGNIGCEEKEDKNLLSPENVEVINHYYKRVLIASIPSIDDFSGSKTFYDTLKNKIQHVGFVTRHFDEAEILQTRRQRGLNPHDKWIVCSAGGGRLGDALVKKCVELSTNPRFADCHFDVVWGGYSDLAWPNDLYDTIRVNERVVYSRKTSALPQMHASADVVICSGGYNSLMESMQGRTKNVLAFSVQTNSDEQKANIAKLGLFYPIQEIIQLEDLESMLAQCLSTTTRISYTLPDSDGATRIKSIIENDLREQKRKL